MQGWTSIVTSCVVLLFLLLECYSASPVPDLQKRYYQNRINGVRRGWSGPDPYQSDTVIDSDFREVARNYVFWTEINNNEGITKAREFAEENSGQTAADSWGEGYICRLPVEQGGAAWWFRFIDRLSGTFATRAGRAYNYWRFTSVPAEIFLVTDSWDRGISAGRTWMRVEGPTLYQDFGIDTVTLVNARDFTQRRPWKIVPGPLRRDLDPDTTELNWDGDGEIPGFGCEAPIDPGNPFLPGQCGVHIVQKEKSPSDETSAILNNHPVGLWPFDITLFDARHQTIGS